VFGIHLFSFCFDGKYQVMRLSVVLRKVSGSHHN